MTLTTSEIVSKVIGASTAANATTTATANTAATATTPAPASTSATDELSKYDTVFIVAGEDYRLMVSGILGAELRIPAGSIPANVQVRAKIVDAPTGAASPVGSVMTSKVLSLRIPATVSKSLTLELPRSSTATRRQLNANSDVVPRMHWLDKLKNTWTEVCGEQTASNTGGSVWAVVEPFVLNNKGFNPQPVPGCKLCDDEGGLLALYDIPKSQSTCLTAATTTPTPAPSWDSAAVIGGAIGGTLGGLLLVGLCVGFFLRYYMKSENASKGKQESLLRGTGPSKQEIAAINEKLAEPAGPASPDQGFGIDAKASATDYVLESVKDSEGGVIMESRSDTNSPVTLKFDSNLIHLKMSREAIETMEERADGSLGRTMVSPDGLEKYQVLGDVLVISQQTPRVPSRVPSNPAMSDGSPASSTLLRRPNPARPPMPEARNFIPGAGVIPMIADTGKGIKSVASLNSFEQGWPGQCEDSEKDVASPTPPPRRRAPISYSILPLSQVNDATPEKVGSHTKNVVDFVSAAMPGMIPAVRAKVALSAQKKKKEDASPSGSRAGTANSVSAKTAAIPSGLSMVTVSVRRTGTQAAENDSSQAGPSIV